MDHLKDIHFFKYFNRINKNGDKFLFKTFNIYFNIFTSKHTQFSS